MRYQSRNNSSPGRATVTKLTRRAVLLSGVAAIAACSQTPTKFLDYDGPAVTGVMLYKSQKVMLLMHDDQVLRSFRFELGSQPWGHKQFEGDGRTPEGTYLINRRNPNSAFHLSLGISYPDTNDVAFAESQGRLPGGEIFIHGTPDFYLGQPDWTAGCIAVTNDEIEEIYAMVRDGTPIWLFP